MLTHNTPPQVGLWIFSITNLHTKNFIDHPIPIHIRMYVGNDHPIILCSSTLPMSYSFLQVNPLGLPGPYYCNHKLYCNFAHLPPSFLVAVLKEEPLNVEPVMGDVSVKPMFDRFISET